MIKMEVNLEIISKELIKPSSPTTPENRNLEPSYLDQLSPPGFIPLIFWYQNQHSSSGGSETNIINVDSSETSQYSQRLKQSLSETLTKFYPLAGKLNGGDHSICCDDSGVLFVEAKVQYSHSHSSLSAIFQNAPLETLNRFLPFDPNPIGKDPTIILDTYPRNEILLGVQISWFECGGHAVGVCISHRSADFASFVTFMNSWAAKNRVGSTNRLPVLLQEPDFDLGRQHFPPLDTFPGLNPVPDPAGEGKLTCKRFLFSKEKLAELKREAASSPPDGTPPAKNPTRVEITTAFLWKNLIKVERAKNQAAKKMFTAKHTVNLRSRMSRLASNDHDQFPFGNFAVVTSASFASDDEDHVHGTDQEEDIITYQDLVGLISSSIRKVNEDHVVNSLLPNLVNLCGGGRVEPPPEKAPETVITRDSLFVIWCRFPVYDVDFGWGKPISVCPAGNPVRPGVILMSTRCGNGIEAWIGLAEEEMDMLPDDLLSLAIT